MTNWESLLIGPQISLRQAFVIIDNLGTQALIVVDSSTRLLGVLTDGDIRRGLVKGITLDDSIDKVMKCDPVFLSDMVAKDIVIATMRQKALQLLPILNEYGQVVGAEILRDVIQCKKLDNPIILMAGGQGMRLRPLTETCPKPLLKFGPKPILEHILEDFVAQGFTNFYIAVNYMADMIQNHFTDGANWGAKISYLVEKKPLGTAGALSLLPKGLEHSVIVMNGDILTKIEFSSVLLSHCENKSDATMCVREYSYQVPYGIAQCDGKYLRDIEERPVQRFWVSGGVYVIEPSAINMIVENEYCDMPNLFRKLIKQSFITTIFPITDYWLDVGNHYDFERARLDYSTYFDKKTT